MSTEFDLLAAVVAAPADDNPRLVYADFLDDHAGTVPCKACDGRGKVHRPYPGGWDACPDCSGTGEVPDGRAARAEFIRVQVELAAKGCLVRDEDTAPAWADEWVGLRDRMMRLLWADDGRGRPNWESWCWSAARDDDGQPCRGDGRGGTVLTPHGSVNLPGWPASCAVPLPGGGLLYQEFRRGFVSHVRGPLAAFWGECEACGGENWLRVRQHIRAGSPCPACSGTGTTSGPTPAFAELVRANPVEAVEVTDRRPWTWLTPAPSDMRAWTDDPDDTYGSSLPRGLVRSLRGYDPEYRRGNFFVYPTEAEARAALSAALLDAARGRVPANTPEE